MTPITYSPLLFLGYNGFKKPYTGFLWISTPALIISMIDMPRHLFDTRRSNEAHYLEDKMIIMSSFGPALLRDQAVIWEQALKQGSTVYITVKIWQLSSNKSHFVSQTVSQHFIMTWIVLIGRWKISPGQIRRPLMTETRKPSPWHGSTGVADRPSKDIMEIQCNDPRITNCHVKVKVVFLVSMFIFSWPIRIAGMRTRVISSSWGEYKTH